jgi:hypothetical protein
MPQTLSEPMIAYRPPLAIDVIGNKDGSIPTSIFLTTPSRIQNTAAPQAYTIALLSPTNEKAVTCHLLL